MAIDYSLPPTPVNAPPYRHAVLKRIYPWDEYNINLVMQWLYAQAARTGFLGSFEDFKLRYGAYIEATDPQDINNLIENYTGTYHIKPLLGIDQVLKTKNKVLNQDIIIEAIPESIVPSYDTYSGNYRITPLARVDQILRTNDKLMEQNMIVEKIPYYETSNDAGGYTAIIG